MIRRSGGTAMEAGHRLVTESLRVEPGDGCKAQAEPLTQQAEDTSSSAA